MICWVLRSWSCRFLRSLFCLMFSCLSFCRSETKMVKSVGGMGWQPTKVLNSNSTSDFLKAATKKEFWSSKLSGEKVRNQWGGCMAEESAFPSVPRSMQPPRGPGWLSPSRSSASPHSHATLHFQAQILRVFSILLKLGSWSQWKNGLRNHKMRSLMADGRWPQYFNMMSLIAWSYFTSGLNPASFFKGSLCTAFFHHSSPLLWSSLSHSGLPRCGQPRSKCSQPNCCYSFATGSLHLGKECLHPPVCQASCIIVVPRTFFLKRQWP